MVFFLIGAPYKGKEENVWNDIQKHVLSAGIGSTGKGKQFSADLQRYKMGNLDSLMFINDSLIKQDTALESLLRKVERQYLDITEKNTYDFVIESREGPQQIEQFVLAFKWDDSRFPRNQPLADILKAFHMRTSHVDSDLRGKISNYQEVKNQAQQMAKKEGNLLVRDLVDVLKEPIVKPKDFVYSDYLTTVVAIVPKQQVQEWLACYEFLNENVVPRSAKQFTVDDKDSLTIWRVVLMKTSLEKEVEIQEDVAPDEQQHQGRKQRKLTPVEEFIVRARDKLKY